MPPFFRVHFRKLLLGAGAFAAVAALIHFAPAWLRADATPDAPYRGISRRLFLSCCGFTAVLVAVLALVKPALFDARKIKSWLLVAVFLSVQLLLFLLPPFQGPDELAHWFTALKFNRPNCIEQEPALYNLPYTLQANALPGNRDAKFDPRTLRAPPQVLGGGDFVNYANRTSYPAVTVVSLFFPRVQTMQEALVFYYLCRFLPLLGLFLLLVIANRRFELPYLALWFFSLPLVLQQFTVISTDTLVNFGTFAVALLCQRLARKVDWLSFAALLILCFVVTATKPVTWGLFAVALVFIPYEKIPRKAIVLPLAALLLAAAFYVAVRYAGATVVALRNTDEVSRQVAAIATKDGFFEFLNLYFATLGSAFRTDAWAGSLGWLDTDLSAHHLTLIRYGFYLSVLLDIGRYFLRREELRGNFKTAAIASGVVVFHFVALTLSMSALLFVTFPPSQQLTGMQMRYWFPGAIFALCVPFVMLARDENGRHTAAPQLAGWRARAALGLDALALGFCAPLLFARGIELFADLAIRYW